MLSVILANGDSNINPALYQLTENYSNSPRVIEIGTEICVDEELYRNRFYREVINELIRNGVVFPTNIYDVPPNNMHLHILNETRNAGISSVLIRVNAETALELFRPLSA